MARPQASIFMANLLITIAIALLFSGKVIEANFASDMYITWGAQQSTMTNNGNNLQLVLTNYSGAGVRTYKSYLYGSFQVLLKLIPGNSAGTVTTYYLSSTGDFHDEIDFEFLGNVSGQPYTIHTNIFTQGIGNREQQFKPWFDPTADFHNYTIHWNPSEVVWFVDSIPIRVFRNYESHKIGFPSYQGMWVYSTLWNADDWATQGGRVKTDWTQAPFIASYTAFNAPACVWLGAISVWECSAVTPANWWTSPSYSQLSYSQYGQMQWVRNNFMIYDYCKDFTRFNNLMPAECSLPQY
ncbi:probable xyloglucan endotransglucosylase/hydrolase protein 26 [Impatiens glandulifera]|uniref:probable xyloglucan endotransglucosylase/hydrolase protein 26 n=1 Tax=Impatiens glandulifera TaxID=253017 RepID=UPI001FB0E0ED|nr:probable xyloglucan endotransglucosylase/hydrolase protein 26 [Impatiens glandulifera]